jgi:hypothetical protein
MDYLHGSVTQSASLDVFQIISQHPEEWRVIIALWVRPIGQRPQ